MGRVIVLIAAWLLLLCSNTFGASQDADVKGKVVDQNNKPVAAASIYLMSSASNILIKTALTDESGEYVILKAPKGSYYIEVTSVGYSKSKSEIFELSDEGYQVPQIVLSQASQSIETVRVEARAPMVQSKDGKLILNVENSTLAAGNNALEVIKRAPGVSVDKDDNLQLMGQQGVTVTIDGRQTFMTGEQLATFLKSTDAAQIKSVEVSTTRQAKDDAEGAVGTINIVLKKNNTEGFNGSFIASGAHGKYVRGNSSLNLNYRKKNTTVFGSYAYTNDKVGRDLGLERTIENNGKSTIFDQDANLIEKETNHNYRLGVEQKTSSRNTMLLQFTGNNNKEDGENISISNIGPSKIVIDSVLRSDAFSLTKFNRFSANFNNEFKIDTLGSKLTFDADWSMFRNTAHTNYIYNTKDASGSLIHPEERERSDMPIDIDIYVSKLDYVKPLKKGKIELGVKYSNVTSDNDLGFEHLVDGNWQDYPGRPNYFVYKEQVSAGYIDYSTQFGKWSTKLGVRAEYTVSDGTSITKKSRVKRDYLDFFPSANLSYNLSQNHILSLSYARKISRPNYRYLNPFRYYIDKLTFQEGNPYVNPQYTHGLSLNYTLMQMFNFTVGTDITNDAMVESMGQNKETNETWITRDNLAKTVTSYVNMNIPYRIGSFWTMNNNLTGVYMHFKGPIAGYYADLGSFFMQGTSMHTFKMNKQFSAEANINGNTPFIYNVYRISGRVNLDLGLNYNFKDQKSSLKFAVTDVFKSNRNDVRTDFEEFNSNIRQYNDNQTFRVTFTHKFGNLKQQIRRRDASNEEKERAN